MSEVTKPVPAITPELRPFFDAAREGRLVVRRCAGCGRLGFPPRRICPSCLERKAEWTPVSGRGSIFSHALVHQVYHPGFATEVPYPVVLVELEEGCRLLSNVVGCAPERLRIGLPVEVVFERLDDDVTLPKFRPR